MITKWKVFNFKSIQNETELELGPLTIFAGANSSGKSTFIQSILLIAQTLAHKVGSRSVVLNGAFANLGQFDDLKSNDGQSEQITIKYTCQPMPDSDPIASGFTKISDSDYYFSGFNHFQEITCEVSFDANPSSPSRELFQIQPHLFSTYLSCVYGDEDNVDQTAQISIRQSIKDAASSEEIDGDLHTDTAYSVKLDETSMDEVKYQNCTAEPINCQLRHFLPDVVEYNIDPIVEDAKTITDFLSGDMPRALRSRRMRRDLILSKKIIAVLQEVIEEAIDYDFIFEDKGEKKSLFYSDQGSITLLDWREKLHETSFSNRQKIQSALEDCQNLYDRIYNVMQESVDDESKRHASIFKPPPSVIDAATRYLDLFFTSSLKYLGPLRDSPKPLYPISPFADPRDVGLRGEHTALILELHKNERIPYIPSASFENSKIDREITTRSLEEAVIDWLKYLGVASSVESKDMGKLGHELKVGLSDYGSTHDLTHVGVGVSQVLPILVMCLLADTDSTLVFEQPELHLHPKVQTLLGDFFLSMALCKKQCIIETHSEYLIDRLRFRIAASSSELKLNELTKVYFVEKPSQNSIFRDVVINEYGAVLDWPEGFFDQSQEQAENILNAAAKKRKASQEGKDV